MQDLGKLIGFTALMQIPFRDDPDALAYLEEIRLALKELEALKAEPQKVEPTNLEAVPAVDAVPVVRCKGMTRPEWYCWDGDREETAEEEQEETDADTP